MDASVYDAISQVTELEEKVYVELKVELEDVFSSLQHTSNNAKFIHLFFCFSPQTLIPFVSQRVNDFVKAMEQTSYNIKEELPDLVDHSRKILGKIHSLILVFR